MYEIDKIDVKIVNFLLENGRMKSSEIARNIGDISERAVRYRIDRMIEEGVIYVTAIVSPKAFGLNTFADVWLEVESDKILEVANKMAEFENVSYVAEDTAEIYRFVTEVVRKVPGVRKTVTSIVPIVLKDIYQWRVPGSVAESTNKK